MEAARRVHRQQQFMSNGEQGATWLELSQALNPTHDPTFVGHEQRQFPTDRDSVEL